MHTTLVSPSETVRLEVLGDCVAWYRLRDNLMAHEGRETEGEDRYPSPEAAWRAYESRIEALIAAGFRQLQPVNAPELDEPPAPSRARRARRRPAWLDSLPADLKQQLRSFSEVGEANPVFGHRMKEIVPLLRPCIDLFVDDATVGERARQSRIGGRPGMPEGHPWPMVGSTPLAFIAQVHVTKLWRSQDLEARLPPEGQLLFFGQLGWPIDEGEESYGQACGVLYFSNDATLVLRTPPHERCLLIEPRRVHPRARLTAPHGDSDVVGQLGMTRAEADEYTGEIFGDMQPERDAVHMLFGYPTALGACRSGDLHLAQFDDDSAIGLDIGDCQPFRIYVRGGNLADPRVRATALGTIDSDDA